MVTAAKEADALQRCLGSSMSRLEWSSSQTLVLGNWEWGTEMPPTQPPCLGSCCRRSLHGAQSPTGLSPMWDLFPRSDLKWEWDLQGGFLLRKTAKENLKLPCIWIPMLSLNWPEVAPTLTLISVVSLLHSEQGRISSQSRPNLRFQNLHQALKKEAPQDFPGGAVVKNLPANTGNTGSRPGRGRYHMLWSN